jgi:Pretoxin HINT domain
LFGNAYGIPIHWGVPRQTSPFLAGLGGFGLGLGQGLLNILNGLTDDAINLLINAPINNFNSTVGLIPGVPDIPNVEPPDWSNGAITDEDPALHDLSKKLGAWGVETLAMLKLFGGGCFAAGTPILTPDGSKLIEEICRGDLVMAAPDDDPSAGPVPRQVEQIFENYLPTLDLHVNGRTIRTTAEHPFWVKGRGWVNAHQLKAGDQLRTHDGRWLEVEGQEGPRPPATVYNVSVAEYHTYFVGHQVWGFAVWSHNIGECGTNAPNAELQTARQRLVGQIDDLLRQRRGFRRTVRRSSSIQTVCGLVWPTLFVQEGITSAPFQRFSAPIPVTLRLLL